MTIWESEVIKLNLYWLEKLLITKHPYEIKLKDLFYDRCRYDTKEDCIRSYDTICYHKLICDELDIYAEIVHKKLTDFNWYYMVGEWN